MSIKEKMEHGGFISWPDPRCNAGSAPPLEVLSATWTVFSICWWSVGLAFHLFICLIRTKAIIKNSIITFINIP